MEIPCPIRTTRDVERPLTTFSATSPSKRLAPGPKEETRASKPSGTFVPSGLRCSCTRPTRVEAREQTSVAAATTPDMASTAPRRIPVLDAATSTALVPTAAAAGNQRLLQQRNKAP